MDFGQSTFNSTNYDFTRFDDHFSDHLVQRDSLFVVIPLTVLYAFILVAGIIGNLINCWVIVKIKCMRTTTNYYLFSLSISDLLLLTSGLPQEIYLIWYRYPYIFGETFCVLRGLIAEMSANATVLTITAFSVERYIAVCHPFLAYSVADLSRTTKLILSIWLAALLFAIPQALQFGLVPLPDTNLLQCTLKRTIVRYSFELSTLFFFVVPLLVICVLYAAISLKLKANSKRAVFKSSHNFSASSNETPRTSISRTPRRSPRVHKLLAAVVLTFFLCWAPFHAQRLVAIYGMRTPDNPGSELMFKIYDVVTYVSAILYYTSSMINPVVYQITSKKFRRAFKEITGTFHRRTSANTSSR